LIHDPPANAVLLVQKPESYFLLEFKKNPLFPFRLLIYLGIYLSILFFILIIRKMQRIQIEKKQALKDQIMRLQLKTINNQMDPHFTFNVFNSIAHILKNNENEFAYRSFLKFTAIIRSTLIDSDKVVRKLKDEINFVENYLELEKLRFKKQFDYNILLSQEVDGNILVPKMILQIFTENSVKHGLRQSPEGGRLDIGIRMEEKRLKLIIEDNGIGRERAKEFSNDSTGMGLKIMDQYIQLFNQFNQQKIHYHIEDLFQSNGNPAGTRVTVEIE
jgi:LytS/YehU family sensor histidine kinase